MNVVHLLGNMGKDPEIKQIGDKMVANFTLATRGRNQAEKTDWHNIVAWGKTAELIQQYCGKGSKIQITGRLQYSSWEKDGKTNWKTEIVAESIEFVETKKTDDTPEDRRKDLPF